MLPAGHLAIGMVCLVLAGGSASAGEDRLEDYGGVSPTIPCPRVDQPPDQNAAELLIICSQSYDNFAHAKVDRTFNVHLQVEPPRAYAVGDPGNREIDPRAPVYPITGTWSTATCSPVSDFMRNAGRNCLRIDFAGDGICYYNPAKAWVCTIGGSRTDSAANVPPPR